VLGKGAARLGEHHATARADEEIGAERVLELADLPRDRGLRDAQRRGGSGERAELDRGAEAATRPPATSARCSTGPRSHRRPEPDGAAAG
jgi:hypothetical protein